MYQIHTHNYLCVYYDLLFITCYHLLPIIYLHLFPIIYLPTIYLSIYLKFCPMLALYPVYNVDT